MAWHIIPVTNPRWITVTTNIDVDGASGRNRASPEQGLAYQGRFPRNFDDK